MALTQDQVNWWFEQNPDATADEVAEAVKSVGGLEGNAGLAGMIANRYSIAEPDVTNYYNAYVTPTTPTTPTTNTQTFTDTITDGTPTTPTTSTTDTSTVLDNIISTPTTQQDLLTTLAAPADNITSTGGYTKSATAPTSGGVSNVIEGDDIDTQIAQLPEEYASWRPSSVPGYADLVRKSDGVVLQRTKSSTFSDADLLKMGLSFIPGMAPFVAGYNALDAARRGDIVGAIIGGTGLVPGMENINTALKVGQAIDQNNPFGAVTALAGNTDAQKLLGLGDVNVGGFTAKDVMAAGSLVQAANSNNTAGVLTHLGTLTGSSDTVLAGRALSLYNRVLNGDVKALGEAMSLSNSIASGSTGNTGSTTGANITTLTDEDLAELQPGELNAYQTGGVQGLADFRRDMRLLNSLTTSGRTGDDMGGGDITTTSTDVSGLPTGVQLASTGDGVFRTDVGGVPTYAESSNASSVKAPLGYTLLSMSESDDKPEGSYYDITANAWFKPDTAVTNLTGSTTIQADADLFNNSIGTLDQLDTTRTADEFADFLATIGITNATQLTDSGLSNQDILDLINATDDTVTVTDTTGGGTTSGNITDTTGLDTGPVIPNGDDNIDTVTVTDTITGATGNDDIDTVTVTDTITGATGNDDIDTVTVTDTITGATGNDTILNCAAGFEPNATGTECVAIKTTLDCPEGYEPNEAGTECIAVLKVEECKDGKVRDPITGECVLPKVEDDECKTGYERVNGTCVPVCKDGYIRNLETGVCEKKETPCPAGQTRNAEGKCVPIKKTEECKPGFERVNGVCVPVCQTGYKRVNGVCKKITADTVIPTPTTSGLSAQGEKIDPIYAGAMDDFDLFATLEELLSENSDEKDTKKDNKKSKDKTKMATGGHLDDLLAEQMTVDDLLKLLR